MPRSTLARGLCAALVSHRDDGQSCRYRTASALAIWPKYDGADSGPGSIGGPAMYRAKRAAAETFSRL